MNCRVQRDNAACWSPCSGFACPSGAPSRHFSRPPTHPAVVRSLLIHFLYGDQGKILSKHTQMQTPTRSGVPLPREWDPSANDADPSVAALVPLTAADEGWLLVELMLRNACPAATLVSLQRVQWPRLWDSYTRYCIRVRLRMHANAGPLTSMRTCARACTQVRTRRYQHEFLADGANERLLFHGTGAQSISEVPRTRMPTCMALSLDVSLTRVPVYTHVHTHLDTHAAQMSPHRSSHTLTASIRVSPPPASMGTHYVASMGTHYVTSANTCDILPRYAARTAAMCG